MSASNIPGRFTVTPRDPSQPPALIRDAVQHLASTVPGVVVERLDTTAGVAAVQVPPGLVEAARAALGVAFELAPNVRLEHF